MFKFLQEKGGNPQYSVLRTLNGKSKLEEITTKYFKIIRNLFFVFHAVFLYVSIN